MVPSASKRATCSNQRRAPGRSVRHPAAPCRPPRGGAPVRTVPGSRCTSGATVAAYACCRVAAARDGLAIDPGRHRGGEKAVPANVLRIGPDLVTEGAHLVGRQPQPWMLLFATGIALRPLQTRRFDQALGQREFQFGAPFRGRGSEFVRPQCVAPGIASGCEDAVGV